MLSYSKLFCMSSTIELTICASWDVSCPGSTPTTGAAAASEGPRPNHSRKPHLANTNSQDIARNLHTTKLVLSVGGDLRWQVRTLRFGVVLWGEHQVGGVHIQHPVLHPCKIQKCMPGSARVRVCMGMRMRRGGVEAPFCAGRWICALESTPHASRTPPVFINGSTTKRAYYLDTKSQLPCNKRMLLADG